MRRALALGVAVALGASFSVGGCGAFTATDPTPKADGGTSDAGVVAARRITVELEWPSLASLDPRSLGALTSFDLELFDGDTSVVKVPVPLTELGKPIDLGERTTGGRVRVVASGVQGNRLVAYGERRDVDVALSPTVPVAVRRRLFYFTSSDRDTGQLRVVDMAPAELAEPGTKELTAPLPSLRKPSGLVATSDGKWVVQSGFESTTATNGQLAVLSTSDHSREIVPLDFAPAGIAPIDAGRRILVAPDSGTSFGVLDPASRSVTKISSTFQGGKLSVGDLAVHPDRSRVAMIADYDTGTGTTHQIVVFDGTKLESKPIGEEPSGVRWARDGGSLVVSLRSGDVSIRSPDGATERARIPKAASDNTVGVLVHPTAPYAYVSGEGKLRVYDLVAGKIVFESGGDGRGPEYQLTSMARLPYPPRRVIAGQSDPGNNWTQARLVEIPDGQIAPAKIELRSWNNLDVGSVSSISPLFAEPL